MSRPTRYLLRLTAAGATLALVAVAAHTAFASNSGPGGGGDGGGGGGTLAPTKVTVINQVADTAGNGLITDADLKNPWGLALGPSGGALWVANNNTNTSTLYTGGLNGAAVTKSTLTVAIPGGKPTGQAFSGGTDFVVTGSGGSGPARFIFSSDQGDITAWNPTADRTNAILMAHVNGAGLPRADLPGRRPAATSCWPTTSATTGSTCSTAASTRSPWPPGSSSTATSRPGSHRSTCRRSARRSTSHTRGTVARAAPTPGSDAGYVDVFTNNGMTVSRIVSASGPRAPWGLAVAPSTWGAIAGDLLVGSFHDGFIYVYQGTRFVGQLATTEQRRGPHPASCGR